MGIDSFFNKIMVINLDESTDRWKDMVIELENANIKNYERIPGIKLKTLDGIPKEHYGNLDSWQKVNEFYKKGIIGANTSHINAIRLAKERKYDNVLILEDDVGIRSDANEILEKTISQLNGIKWDILYLGGGNQSKENMVFVTENFIKAQNLLSAHAYAVNAGIYDKIINDALNHGSELDVFYRDEIQKNYNCLCINPKLIWQKNGYSITLQGFRDMETHTKEG